MSYCLSFLFIFVCLFFNTINAQQAPYRTKLAVDVDYLAYSQEGSNDENIVVAPTRKVTKTITTDELVNNQNFRSGYMVSLKLFQSKSKTWVFSYMGKLNWHRSLSLEGNKNVTLASPISLSTNDFYDANSATTTYNSSLLSYQIYQIRQISPRYIDNFSVSWLIGATFYNPKDSIKVYFNKHNRTSQYQTHTKNKSVGLQVGGTLEYNTPKIMTCGLNAKGGILFNRGTVKMSMNDNNSTESVTAFTEQKSNPAYMVELFPTLEIRPVKQFFILVNYKALILIDIVTADNNLGPTYELDHNSRRTYQGVTAGIQFNF